jgi:predicted transcriptional regulator
MDRQEELVRLRVIELRDRLGSQTDTIIELNRAGFGTSRIAELLGTTPNTVNVTLQKAKRRGQKGKRADER